MNTSSNEGIRVFVVDDHAIVREGMKYFLEAFDGFVYVGASADGLKAVEACKTIEPDIVLMDLFMPTINGIEATRLLRTECPQIKVILMTSSTSCEFIIQALRAGVANYVLKGISLNGLAEVIRATYAGQLIITDETTQILISAFRHSQKPFNELTQREREIMALMVKGHHNTEIAQKLDISVSTVKNHISSIFKKLNTSSRSEAVAQAVYFHNHVDLKNQYLPEQNL